MNKRLKVYVGLSGGVDSAVSAYLLLRQGYDVTGVFIKTWQPEWMKCTWKEDRREAMRVAAHLDIPFKTLDLSHEYRDLVAQYMIDEYKAGRTPNPDVMCNKEIKFGYFFDFAMKEGADFIATGHYANTMLDKDNSSLTLYRGVDKNKDQSYFLWAIKKEILPKLLFPIGQYTKKQVRDIAFNACLPNHSRKDSQGICFLGMVDIEQFLSHYVKAEKGDVLNTKGEIIGYHRGAIFYTIGERHGFTVTDKTPVDRPFYVISKDMEKNTITVQYKNILSPDHTDSQDKKIFLKNINLFLPLDKSAKYDLQLRYRQSSITGTVANIKENNIEIELDSVPESYSIGQSCVIYRDNKCLGGGIID